MSLLGDLLDVRESFSSPATDAGKSLTPAQRQREKTTRGAQPSGGKFDESKHPRGRGKFISKGGSGSDVKTVQAGVGVKADGSFGERTRQAVMKFQREHGLKVDGIVGEQTALALKGQYKTARATKPGGLRHGSLSNLRKARSAKKKPSAPSRARGGRLV